MVIAGSASAVERAMSACKDKGAKRALPLPVSVPSHCALMEPAAEQLAAKLNGLSLNEPQVSVINNVDVSVETNSDAIKQALIRQLHNPVRWTETIEKLKQAGVTDLVECGSGNVLSGLNKRISRELTSHGINDIDKLSETIEKL